MPRLFLGGSLVLALLCSAPVRAQVAPQTLELGKPLERELTAGRTDAYLLRLSANQIAHVVVEQQGVDIVLSVLAPDGRLFSVDSPNGSAGEESATVAARQAGAYRLEVRALTASDAGRYAIRLDRFVAETEYQTERLAGLGRLWGAVKFFHPFLAYKDIDWDGALIKALPGVKAARTPTEYRSAITGMLDVLADPVTTAQPTSMSDGPSSPAACRRWKLLSPLSTSLSSTPSAGRRHAGPRPQRLGDRRRCWPRSPKPRASSSIAAPALPRALCRLLSGHLSQRAADDRPAGPRSPWQRALSPAQRLCAAARQLSGGYSSAFLTRTPDVIVGQAKEKKPLAVLVDERTPDISAILSGLQAAGAAIVRVGKAGGERGRANHADPVARWRSRYA